MSDHLGSHLPRLPRLPRPPTHTAHTPDTHPRQPTHPSHAGFPRTPHIHTTHTHASPNPRQQRAPCCHGRYACERPHGLASCQMGASWNHAARMDPVQMLAGLLSGATSTRTTQTHAPMHPCTHTHAHAPHAHPPPRHTPTPLHTPTPPLAPKAKLSDGRAWRFPVRLPTTFRGSESISAAHPSPEIPSPPAGYGPRAKGTGTRLGCATQPRQPRRNRPHPHPLYPWQGHARAKREERKREERKRAPPPRSRVRRQSRSRWRSRSRWAHVAGSLPCALSQFSPAPCSALHPSRQPATSSWQPAARSPHTSPREPTRDHASPHEITRDHTRSHEITRDHTSPAHHEPALGRESCFGFPFNTSPTAATRGLRMTDHPYLSAPPRPALACTHAR